MTEDVPLWLKPSFVKISWDLPGLLIIDAVERSDDKAKERTYLWSDPAYGGDNLIHPLIFKKGRPKVFQYNETRLLENVILKSTRYSNIEKNYSDIVKS